MKSLKSNLHSLTNNIHLGEKRERERGVRRQKKNLAINIQGGKENQERHAKGRKEKKKKVKGEARME